MKKLFSFLMAAVMVISTLLALPFSASAMTEADASGAKAVTASATKFTDNNASIVVDDGYLYYKISVAESGAYSLYTEEVDGADTCGELYLSTNLNMPICENDDGYYFDTGDFGIECYLEKGKTYYLAVCYYDNDDLGKRFNVVIEKSTKTVALDGVLYAKDSVKVGVDDKGVDIMQDIYYVSGNYLTKPTAATIKSSINSIPVKNIGSEAFKNCKYLTSVTIENGIENIVEYAFYGCTNLASVTIPNSVKEIDSRAFNGCTGLASIKLPSALKTIGPFAFSDTAIKSITIPASVEIMDRAFSASFLLESINVNSANPSFKSVDGVVFSKDGKTIVTYPAGKAAKAYNIPSGVESVGSCAFEYSSIDKVIFPSTVKSIASHAFEAALCKEVVLNEGLESIGVDAFYESRLNTVKLPDTLKAIGGSAFYYSNLVSVDIPSSVTSIGYYCFYNKYLKSAIINNDSVSIANYAFPNNATLYGHTGSTAQAFATKHGNNFVALSEAPCSTHSYVVGKLILEPTCQSTGKASTYCAACGETGPETEVEKLSHHYYYGICTMCLTSSHTSREIKLNSSVNGTVACNDDANDVIYRVTKDGKYTMSFYNASQFLDWSIYAIRSNGTVYLTADNYDSTDGSFTVNAKAGDVIILYVVNSYDIDESINFTASVKCEHGATKSTTTKATTSKDGKIVKTCSVCGKAVSTTVIPKASSIKLEATTLTYNGKVRTPKVIVKDSKGKTLKKNTDYTVSYASGRKNVGKYAVKITFKGNYSGTKTLYFTIKPKATSISSVSAGSKKFTVKWKKQSTQVTGYQIQYSTSSKFTSPKTVTVSSYKTTSKTISKLKSKKKYYVRVRTYKTVGKTKYYSSWSKAKSITTKK